MTEYLITPLQRDAAEAVLGWSYEPPYQVYNLSAADLELLLAPEFRYHQVRDSAGVLVGYCCYGEDARVPGGDYDPGEPAVLDVGIGMNPDLVGRGLGEGFVSAVLEFALKTYKPEMFRVTVAEFNLRSQKTFDKLGFHETQRFARKIDGMPFILMERKNHE